MNVIFRIAALDRVRADALRDAARFAARDARAADAIEQRRLAVIDVTEHRNDRRTRDVSNSGLVFFLLDDDFFAGFFDDGVEAEFLRDVAARRSRECSD